MTLHFYWTYLETQKWPNYWYEQSFFVWCLLRQRNGGLNSGLKSATIVTDAFSYEYAVTVRHNLDSRSWHHSNIDNNCGKKLSLCAALLCKTTIINIYQGSTELWPEQECGKELCSEHWLLVCVHCDLNLWVMTFRQGHAIALGYACATIVWNIHIQHDSEELWPGQGFRIRVHFDLDDILLQDQYIPLGHGQQLCEILSKSNME